MANFFRNIFDAMKFSDDDEEDYADYLNEFDDNKDKKEHETYTIKKPVKNDYKAPVQEISKKWSNEGEAPRKQVKVAPDKGKVVQLRTKELELNVIKPTAFGDCQDICDMLLNGDAVVINLEGFENDLSQRIMDFVSGTVYAIKGQLKPVSKLIYIVSPDNVTISGDLMNLVTSGGVEAPTISSDF